MKLARQIKTHILWYYLYVLYFQKGNFKGTKDNIVTARGWGKGEMGEVDQGTGASLVAQMVKNLPAVQETWVQSLGQEDPLRKEWQPTPLFLPGESRGQRSLVGYTVHGVAKSQTPLSS